MIEELELIEGHARAVAARTAESVEVGPFVALFHPSEEPWLSWASPRGPLGSPESLAAPVAALAAEFAARSRVLRVEFNAALWPTLSRALEAAGLALEVDLPLLGALPGSFRPRPAREVKVRLVGPEDDLAFFGSLMKRGFEAPGKIEPDEIERIRAALVAGTRYALAEHTGLPAASGASSPIAGITEIAAVSTLPTMRRRGAASAVVTFLCAAHFGEGGALAWATCGDAAGYALFQELGFLDLGVRSSWRRR